MRFWTEFKTFAMRGNVIDLAVGFIMGAAFSKIVSSLVDGIVMPLIGLLLGGINIADKTFKLGDAIVKWGASLQSVIDFTLISLSIFILIKLINKFQKNKIPIIPQPPAQVELLTEIRDLLKNKT